MTLTKAEQTDLAKAYEDLERVQAELLNAWSSQLSSREIAQIRKRANDLEHYIRRLKRRSL